MVIASTEPQTGLLQFAGRPAGVYLREPDAITLAASLRSLLDDPANRASFVKKQQVEELHRLLVAVKEQA